MWLSPLHLQEKGLLTIRYVSHTGHKYVIAENVTAVNSNDAEIAADVIANCDMMAAAADAAKAEDLGVIL